MAAGHRGLIALGIAAVAAAGVTLPGASRVHAATNPITFGVPSVMDPIHPFGEPDIGVDALGHVFVSGPTGTGTQRSIWEGSSDGARPTGS